MSLRIDKVVKGNVVFHDHPGSDVVVEYIGDSTYRTVQDFVNLSQSAGRISGGTITDAGSSTINISAGTGWVRVVDDDVSTLKFFNWDAVSGMAIPSGSNLVIYIDYNSGSPEVKSIANGTTLNLDTQFPLGSVIQENGTLHIVNNPFWVSDAITNIIQRLEGTGGVVERDKVAGGLFLGETGTRNITLTAGRIWSRLSDFNIAAIDTSISGTFDAYYSDGVGGWTASYNQTQWDNIHYDNGSGTLATLGSNQYAVLWWYIETDGDLVCLYGINEYSSESGADAEPLPTSVPDRIAGHGLLIAKTIFQKSASTFTSIQSAFTTSFEATDITDHNNLGGLQGGTTGQYYHLTAANHTDLTDGGDSTLHYHSSDRDRANHTGTQPASTISDFDTEVANNSAVAANTAKVSADGSINTHSDVDTSTNAPQRDEVLKWNGTEWVPAAYDASFAMTIASFTDNQVSPQLIGSGTWQPSGAITFTASYNNPPPDSASISVSGTGVSGGFPITLSSPYTSGANTANTSYPSAKDVTVTFTLTAYDGATPRTSTTSVLFRNYIRWGVLTKNTGITSADLLTLSGSQLSNDPAQSKSITAGPGEYLVWAYPASYASLDTNGMIFNGVTCPFQAVATVSHTNEAGFTENYKVYASTNANLGSSTLTTSTSSTLINNLYYGATTTASGYSEADVEGLANSVITNDNTQIWNQVTAATGEYLLFAFPARLGTVVFYVGGFEGGFESPETVSVTNVNGYTENYYVWRSTNSGLGATTVETRSS